MKWEITTIQCVLANVMVYKHNCTCGMFDSIERRKKDDREKDDRD